MGLATAASVRQQLNRTGAPQGFVQSGSNNFQQPKAFGLRASALMSCEAKAKTHGQMIARDKPNPKAALICQSDDCGTDCLRGLNARWAKPLTSALGYGQTDPRLNSQSIARARPALTC